MSLTIKDMLLIEEPTVKILKDELMTVAGWFILPSFVFAVVLEYFGELKFLEVVKKLILILVFIGSFYAFHTEGVSLSFKGSEEILRKVSPNNIFLRKWTETKVKTDGKANWSMLEKFAIPNINDLLGTAFFLMSKVFIWILKLVYTTVYHLTYIFAPLTAVLYFFPITKNSLAGTIQSSLWCMFMPIVLVSILAIVGNSIQVPAGNGEVSIVSIEHILWLFGVTLLLLMSPILTLGILRGGGVALAGSAVGAMVTNAGMKVLKGAEGFSKARNLAEKAQIAKERHENYQNYRKGQSFNGKNSFSIAGKDEGKSEKYNQGQSSNQSSYQSDDRTKGQVKDSTNNQPPEKQSVGNNYSKDSKTSSSLNTSKNGGDENVRSAKEMQSNTRSEMKEGKPQMQSKINSKEKSPEIFREEKRELKSVNNKKEQQIVKRENFKNPNPAKKLPREVRSEV